MLIFLFRDVPWPNIKLANNLYCDAALKKSAGEGSEGKL